jgi:hypothetical protein
MTAGIGTTEPARALTAATGFFSFKCLFLARNVMACQQRRAIEMNYLSITQAAVELGIKPRIISDLLYARALDLNRCPVFAGRRVIEMSYLPALRRVLVQHGKIETAAT